MSEKQTTFDVCANEKQHLTLVAFILRICIQLYKCICACLHYSVRHMVLCVLASVAERKLFVNRIGETRNKLKVCDARLESHGMCP